MTALKYIYTEQGQQESIILPIDFWTDLFNHFDLQAKLEKEAYFSNKYQGLLSNFHRAKVEDKKQDDVCSLFGSWQSEKTGDEIAQEIYLSRNDLAREVEL
jgi:hypothetical protein